MESLRVQGRESLIKELLVGKLNIDVFSYFF